MKSTLAKTASLVSIFALALALPAAAQLGNLNVEGDTVRGGTVIVSGSCGAEASGNVNFSLVNNAGTTELDATATIEENGSFSAEVTIPQDAVAGPATLVAECPDQNLIAVINITDPDDDTPKGPVEAGAGSTGMLGWMLAAVALIAMILAYAYVPKQSWNN